MRYLLHCRVLAKAVELEEAWFVPEAGTATLKDYRYKILINLDYSTKNPEGPRQMAMAENLAGL